MTERDDHQYSKADCKCLNVRSSCTEGGEATSLHEKSMMMIKRDCSSICSSVVVSEDHKEVIGSVLYDGRKYSSSTCNSREVKTSSQKPLRERRHFVLSPLSTFDSKEVHQHVLLECKEKELYFKTKPSRRGNKIEEILNLFERNTQIIEPTSQQPTETKDLSDRVSCKYIPTNHRNVNQIILFRRDEQHHGMSLTKHQHSTIIQKSSPQKPSVQKSFKRKFIELEESCSTFPHVNNSPSMKRLIVAAPTPIIAKELSNNSSLPKTASVFAHAKLRKQKAAALKQSALNTTIITPNCTFHDRIA